MPTGNDRRTLSERLSLYTFENRVIAAATEHYAGAIAPEIPDGPLKDHLLLRLRRLARMADRAVTRPVVIKAPRRKGAGDGSTP